jgi:hypothetical protein
MLLSVSHRTRSSGVRVRTNAYTPTGWPDSVLRGAEATATCSRRSALGDLPRQYARRVNPDGQAFNNVAEDVACPRGSRSFQSPPRRIQYMGERPDGMGHTVGHVDGIGHDRGSTGSSQPASERRTQHRVSGWVGMSEVACAETIQRNPGRRGPRTMGEQVGVWWRGRRGRSGQRRRPQAGFARDGWTAASF